MSADLRPLFERAERDMRPEFRERLLELLRDDPAMHHVDSAEPAEAGPSLDETVVIDLARSGEVDRRNWVRPSAFAAAAIAVVAVGSAAIATMSGDDGDGRPSSEIDLSGAACAAEAVTLDVVHTSSIDIRVGLMPDGSTFCIVNDVSGEALDIRPVDTTTLEDVDSATKAGIVGRGAVGDAASYFLVSVPEGMPVSSIQAPTHQVFSFPTRVGRTFLVIDPGPGDQEEHVTHDLQLYSAARSVLATLVAVISVAPGATATSDTNGTSEPNETIGEGP